MNLKPFFRYLQKQVGRPWNDIYSEIDPSLRPYASWGVHDNVKKIDGKIYYADRLQYEIVSGLYVDPDDGILKDFPKKRSKWRKRTTNNNSHICLSSDPLVQYHQINGVWYEITFRPIVDTDYVKTYYWGCPRPEWDWKIYPPNHPMCLEPRSYSVSEWKSFYGGLIYPVAKRQLNKKEIKRMK